MGKTTVGNDDVFFGTCIIFLSNWRFVIVCSYILVVKKLIAGIIYDVIVEPPSVGSTTDEHGHSRPVRYLQVNLVGTKLLIPF